MRTWIVAAAMLGSTLLGCTTEIFSDQCMTQLADDDGQCPTPGPPPPFPGTPYEPTAYRPDAAFADLCSALTIGFDEVKPAFGVFADATARENADVVADAGARIVAAAQAMRALADGEDDPTYAAAIHELADRFEADGRRASEGDIRNDDGRMLFVDLVSEYGAECYGPLPGREPLTRGQLAALLVEELGLPASDRDPFADDVGGPFEDEANRVAAAGVMSGCSATAFCADDVVTRGGMAEIVVRTFNLPPTDVDFFPDDDGSRHEDAVNRAAAAGLLLGQRDGTVGIDEALTSREVERWFQRLRRR